MNEASLLAKIGLLVLSSVIAVLTALFLAYKARIAAEVTRRGERMSEMEKQIAILSTQVSPLWAAVQSKIAKDLTHPHARFAEMDQLLRELESLTLTPPHHKRLLVLLEERITADDPEVGVDEKDSAMLLKIVMRKVLAEAAEAVEG